MCGDFLYRGRNLLDANLLAPSCWELFVGTLRLLVPLKRGPITFDVSSERARIAT